MPKKILLIEDVPDMQKMIAFRLKANGYAVVTAADGAEGLKKVASEKPDLVVTDYAIPKISGSEVIRALRADEKTRHIPIIVLSAYVHRQMEKGVEVPADVYLPKPFNAAELLGMVEKLLTKT